MKILILMALTVFAMVVTCNSPKENRDMIKWVLTPLEVIESYKTPNNTYIVLNPYDRSSQSSKTR